MTAAELSLRATRMERHPRVNSSRTRPDGALGPQADAGPVIEPEASFLRLLLWDLQPLPSLDRPTRFTFTCQPVSCSRAKIRR